jgi:PBP1b-binding outer membrane lipoprotein LpoB
MFQSWPRVGPFSKAVAAAAAATLFLAGCGSSSSTTTQKNATPNGISSTTTGGKVQRPPAPESCNAFDCVYKFVAEGDLQEGIACKDTANRYAERDGAPRSTQDITDKPRVEVSDAMASKPSISWSAADSDTNHVGSRFVTDIQLHVHTFAINDEITARLFCVKDSKDAWLIFG